MDILQSFVLKSRAANNVDLGECIDETRSWKGENALTGSLDVIHKDL